MGKIFGKPHRAVMGIDGQQGEQKQITDQKQEWQALPLAAGFALRV
jgi:hypothetical protein